MSATFEIAATRVSPASVRQLTVIESRRSWRRVSIWVGFVLTIAILPSVTADWSGGSYTEKLQAFMPMILCTFIAAFRTGRRDSAQDVAESAPVGPDDRGLARLGSLILPVALTVLLAVGLAVASRIEGGFWIGEHSRRTDSALHPISELLQPVLLVALAGALGIAIGRVRRSLSTPLAIVVGIVVFTLFPAYWVWNTPPMATFTPFQSQPLYIDLDPGTSMADTPADWYVGVSDAGEPDTRQLVHEPTILGHDLYLVGLIALAAAGAVRGTRGRYLALTGGVLAVAGVVVQLIVSPL